MKKYIGIMGKAGAGKDTAANMMISMINRNGKKAHRYSFADPLKQLCSHIFDIPLKCMYDQELKEKEVIICTKATYTIERFEQWIIENVQNREKFCHVMVDPKFHDGSGYKRSYQMTMFLLYELDRILTTKFRAVEREGFSSDCYRVSIRYLLQLMGTEIIRNNVHENFWAEVKTDFPEDSIVVIPDCRFVNEVDYITNKGGQICLVKNIDLKRTDLNMHVSEKFVDEVEDYLSGGVITTFENDLKGSYQKLDNQVFKFLSNQGLLK